MYSRAVSALVLAFLVVLVLALSIPSAMARTDEEEKVYSGYAAPEYDFDAEENHWVYENTLSCNPLINDMNTPLSYRKRWYWVEFNGDSLGSYTGVEICRKCLKVKKPNADEKDWVTVRIIEIVPNNDDEAEDDDNEMEDDEDEVEDDDNKMEDDDNEVEDNDGEAEDNYKEVVLRIDISAFNKIDPNQERSKEDENVLWVNYKIVDCGDNAEAP